MSLANRLRELLEKGSLDLPMPGSGKTPERHRRLCEIGREDLSLARLAEAHTDAVAILAESGRCPKPGALYGVWASEIPSEPLCMESSGGARIVSGKKSFCSGAGIVDRALITVREPEQLLIEVDLRARRSAIKFCDSQWSSSAFADTRTATTTFDHLPVQDVEIIGSPGFYLERPGFWHGACGPASCWIGGAAGLVDYAEQQTKSGNPHAMAHLGAMQSAIWTLRACLDVAGREIDDDRLDYHAAMRRALRLRHMADFLCSDILTRFARALGPRPLAFEPEISRRYHELELYIRQCHAELDLESLAQATK